MGPNRELVAFRIYRMDIRRFELIGPFRIFMN